jgi:hypothetical protein
MGSYVGDSGKVMLNVRSEELDLVMVRLAGM